MSSDVPSEVYSSAEVVEPANDVPGDPCNKEKISDNVMGIEMVHDETSSTLDISSIKFLETTSPLELSCRPDISVSYIFDDKILFGTEGGLPQTIITSL